MGCASSTEESPAVTGSPPKPSEVKPSPIQNAPAQTRPDLLTASSNPDIVGGSKNKRGSQTSWSTLPKHVTGNHDAPPKVAKERRAAAGQEAVRDQMRKLAVGGQASAQDEKTAIYEVSDSEDEDEAPEGRGLLGWSKDQQITDAICDALKKNFVFKGIPDSLLLEVVERMHGVSFMAGSVVLQQNALPKHDDCMYYLQLGEAEVEISGAVDQSAKAHGGEERKVVGRTVRIPQKPGWVFGDIALLFNSTRTASVVAKTNITVWALDRMLFLKFVMKHAQGARALRFLRKLPLLKGLSDNDLIRAASRMPQRVYQDGQALIKYGESGEELYLIRYGKVCVLRPDGKGGQIEAVVLGRGQFVGERAVINNKLRSADCIARGTVQVVVMKKKDFMDLDNPLLAWMLDYDAVSTCLRFVPHLKSLKQEQMEQILDRFDAREEVYESEVIINQGDLVDKMYVIKVGEVKLIQDGQSLSDPSFVHEAGGFSYFGDAALLQPFKSPYTIVVASETLQMLSLPKRQLDTFLGRDVGLDSADAVIAALKKCEALKRVQDAEWKQLLPQCEEPSSFSAGDVIVSASSGPSDRIFLVKTGEVVLVDSDALTGSALPGQVDLGLVTERGRLLPGGIFNEQAATMGGPTDLKASLVASSPITEVVTFTAAQLLQVTGGRIIKSTSTMVAPGAMLKGLNFSELELHRIIGTGQFGAVRLVRSKVTNEVYALKSMHKAPIVESKQIEHVLNERRILEEANYPLCVQLKGAYQDKRSLYLLQEWVPGGELFHHLDLEGAFDEPKAVFFAANVLLALEFLHSKGIVYRDLKPENLLLDAQGYLKMADFGFAKYVGEDKTFTICGTPDYQAPEVIMRRGTNKAADYWALGVLIFEMLVGDPPFKSLTGDPWDTFRRTLSGRFYVPNFISESAADIIFKLLQVNPDKRLGSGATGADEIKQHRFFASVDWKALEQKKLPAPIRPKIRNPLDTSNFDNFDDCDVEAPTLPPGRTDKQPNWELWEWIE